jgi:hypothetical protein
MRNALFVLIALLAALGITPASALADANSAPAGRLPADVTPTHYRLSLSIDPRS